MLDNGNLLQIQIVSFLFYESRVHRKDYRFDAIECQNPYEVSTDTWKEAMAKDRSLKWILINSLPLYDQTNEIPSFNEYKKIVLDRTLDYAKMFNVSKVHLVMTEAKDDSDR